MIRTGRVVNLVLGVGDSSKFNLLGGSFGQAGDSALGAGYGARFFPSTRAAVLRGVATPGAVRGGGGDGSIGGPPSRPGIDDSPIDRYRRER